MIKSDIDNNKSIQLMPDAKDIRVETNNLAFVHHDTIYYWHGGFGKTISSVETNVKQGDLRSIGNVIFYAFDVEKKKHPWYKQQVSWAVVANVDGGWLRSFKKAVFNCNL